MYKDKNTSFNTEGNEELDKLLCMLEANAVLSETFKNKIVNLTLWILTNHEKHIDEIKEKIKSLIEEMNWLNIFSTNFIQDVHYLLVRGLEDEILKKEPKKL